MNKNAAKHKNQKTRFPSNFIRIFPRGAPKCSLGLAYKYRGGKNEDFPYVPKESRGYHRTRPFRIVATRMTIGIGTGSISAALGPLRH